MTVSHQRVLAIDGLRGFAVLGIFMMNVQAFGMVQAAYLNPAIQLDLSGLNFWIWWIGHVLFDQKFMALFSLLFGSSLVLLTAKQTDVGARAWPLYYRRTFWLFLIGLIHAYLIWYGDVLVLYAVVGALIFWLRSLGPGVQLGIGLALLTLAPLIMLVIGALLPPAEMADVAGSLTPSFQQIQAEVAAYQGTWTQAFAVRVSSALDMQLGSLFGLFWRTAGLMLIGMAFYKMGLVSGQLPFKAYRRFAIISVGVGLPLSVASAYVGQIVQWNPLVMVFGLAQLLNYLGSLALALTYLCLIMMLYKSDWLGGVKMRLAAVGRMALSNYILQSLLATLFFYGFALGYFSQIERWGQALLVLAMWVLQLTLSPLWMRHFRYGPLEWLWRSLTLGHLQKFRA